MIKFLHYVVCTLKHWSDMTYTLLLFAKLIRIKQANYLTFGGLLSRNAGDFSGSVDGWVDFFEYLSVKQFSVFQVFAK